MNLHKILAKYNRIIDNLYIGNYLSPIDNEFINEKNIKLIINCTKTYNYKSPDNIQVLRLNITDLNSPENNYIISASIDKILEIIQIYIKSNEGVLVHCHMGQQRSAMVVTCYLLKYLKLSLDKSITKIKKQRKLAFLPEITFYDFLKYYEIEVS
jgi:protein-tyrosine phosphatase